MFTTSAAKDEQIILVTEETDDKWQAPLSAIVEPNPKDDTELFFASERDGFNHLYLAKLEAETRAVPTVPAGGEQVATSSDPRYLTGKVTITQLTKGNWQVEWAKWNPAPQNSIVFLSTEGDPASDNSGALGSFQTDRLVRRSCYRFWEIESPNPQYEDNSIIFERSLWNQPDELYAIPKFCLRSL